MREKKAKLPPPSPSKHPKEEEEDPLDRIAYALEKIARTYSEWLSLKKNNVIK